MSVALLSRPFAADSKNQAARRAADALFRRVGLVADTLIRRGTAPNSTATVAPGEGAVVRVGRESVAVYRSPSGDEHVVSAACPHGGALVEFESETQSWVCPRHGARFAIDGSVLDGKRIVDQPLCPRRVLAKSA